MAKNDFSRFDMPSASADPLGLYLGTDPEIVKRAIRRRHLEDLPRDTKAKRDLSVKVPRQGEIKATKPTVADRGYDAVGDVWSGLTGSRYAGATARDNVRDIGEFVWGYGGAEDGLRNIASGDGSPWDVLALAGAVPLVGGGIRAVKRGSKAAGKAARAVSRGVRKILDSDAGRYLTVSHPILDRSRPLYDVTREGEHTLVQRRDVTPQRQPAAAKAKSLDDLRVNFLRDPKTNPALRDADAASRRVNGAPLDRNAPMPKTSLQRQAGIGRAYRAAVEGSPAVKHAIFERYGEMMPDVVEKAGAQNYDQLTEAAYNQMGREVIDQFDETPLAFRYHSGDAEYPTPSAMFKDVITNGNLNVYKGGEPHEFLYRIDPVTGLSQNEMFRAVHDYLGHVAPGSTFRPGGEEIAYAMHSRTMSPLAQMALLSETRGQNSLVNYSPLNADLTGEMNILRAQLAERAKAQRWLENGTSADRAIAERALAEIPPAGDLQARLRDLGQRTQFAPQRAVLLPPEYLDPMTPGGMPEYLRPLLEKTGASDARGVHISRAEGLGATDPSFFGQGHRGQEYRGVKSQGLPNRTYFYSGPEGTVEPEGAVLDHFRRRGIQTHAYEADLKGLYDINEDPEGLLRLAKAYNLHGYEPVLPYNYRTDLAEATSAIPDLERLVREYGYSGYVSDFGPQRAAAMFDPVGGLRAIERGPNGYAEGGLVEGDC